MRTLVTLLFFLTAVSFVRSEVSVVEVPIRVENCTAKRVPGSTSFMVVFRDNFGEVIAIPEDEVARFRQLAIAEGFDQVAFDDYAYIPQPQQAVGNTAKATVTIEHLDQLAFWMDDTYSFFITWDDLHPAPVPTVNAVPIIAIYEFDPALLPPSTPQTATIRR